MKPLIIRSKQRGFTLIEVGIALAIGIVIMLGVARAIQVNQQRTQIAEAITDIQMILVAAVDWKSGRTNTTTISFASLVASLPADWDDGSAANPWGGGYDISGNANGDMIIKVEGITLTGAGQQITDRLSPYAKATNVVTQTTADVTGEVTITYQ